MLGSSRDMPTSAELVSNPVGDGKGLLRRGMESVAANPRTLIGAASRGVSSGGVSCVKPPWMLLALRLLLTCPIFSGGGVHVRVKKPGYRRASPAENI